MIFVVDIDETLSRWNDDRDYLNFVPDLAVIDKINSLHEQGHYIVLFTARGMRSMDRDIDRIRREIRPPLEEWLQNNGVKYNELIMGKPYGDYYIDDKNLSIDQFLEKTF